jgi:hypothetical protein
MALPSAVATGPRVLGAKDVASTAAGFEVQTAELQKTTKKAANTLLVVAIMQALFGLVVYGINQQAISRGQINGPLLLGSLFGVAVLFLGLYFWARSSPFPAAIVGLVVYASLWALDVIVAIGSGHVQTAFNGIIIKILIVVALTNAVKAGVRHRELMRGRTTA